MRNVLVARNNGASPLPQVFLLVLLQVILGHGSLVYERTEKRAPLLVKRLNQTPEDETAEAMWTSSSSSSSLSSSSSSSASSLSSGVSRDAAPPHVRALGFFRRGHVLRSPDELRRLLPEMLNGSDAARRKPDVARSRSRANGRQGDSGLSPLSSSSHFGIPHLVRLGFGAASTKPVYGYRLPAAAAAAAAETGSRDLRNALMLGVGSFLGGMTLIPLVFCLLFLRRRHRQRHLSAADDGGEPKLSLLRHEALPAADDVMANANEPSTISCWSSSSSSSSSASSGSGDASSDTSDTWRGADNVISLGLFGDRDRPEGGSHRRSESSAENSGNASEEIATDLLGSPEAVSGRKSAFWHDRDYERPPPCNNCSPTDFWVAGNRDESGSFVRRAIPDLLLSSEAPDPERCRAFSCTRSVSGEGGVLSCAGGDVLVIIPPGSVQGECRFRVEALADASSFRINDDELILSPIVDVSVSGTVYFRRPITIELPYRALCSCVSDALTLRRLDQRARTKSESASPTATACLDPEAGILDEDDRPRTREATFKCFSNVCTIETNAPGTFCLTSKSRDHTADCRAAPRLCHSNNSRINNGTNQTNQDNIRLCIAIGAKYLLDYRKPNDVSSDCYVRQINYMICLSDNTISGRQEIEQCIRTSGGHVQCTYVPLDVALGSEVKVTLGSVRDPEWPWEIPFDSTSKVIRWNEFCDDYSTLVRVEFRCLSRSDDLMTLTSDDVSIVSTFLVETEQHTTNGLDTVRLNIVADNGFCC